MDMICHTASVVEGCAWTIAARAAMKLRMGKGRRGNCYTTWLPRHLEPRIGFEPMTDNPMSSAHQSKSGQAAMVDVDCCSIGLSYFPRSGRADLNRQPSVPITHNLRPAEKTDG